VFQERGVKIFQRVFQLICVRLELNVCRGSVDGTE
jgi:hypothetical protein